MSKTYPDLQWTLNREATERWDNDPDYRSSEKDRVVREAKQRAGDHGSVGARIVSDEGVVLFEIIRQGGGISWGRANSSKGEKFPE